MITKRSRRILITVLALMVVTAVVLNWRSSGDIDPLPDSQVELTSTVEGDVYKLDVEGNAYRVDRRSGKWHFVGKVFHPREMLAAYVTDGDDVYRIDERDGKRFKTTQSLQEDFEGLHDGVEGLRQLMGPERGWGTVTLQSPQTPTVSSYVALRQKILKEGANFMDAIVAPDSTRAHGGRTALKCVAPAPAKGMITSKSSLSSPLIYFREGDDVWFRASYYAEGARPLTLMDLECEWIEQHGGIRLYIDEGGRLQAELKALDKPKFKQTPETAIQFPLDRWVDVRAHFVLSDDTAGVIQIWQDDTLIVDQRGTTLPLPRAIYSSLEVGISAHSFGSRTATLWVDDVAISSKPLESANASQARK